MLPVLDIPVIVSTMPRNCKQKITKQRRIKNMIETSIKADEGKLYTVIKFSDNSKIEIPINSDGSVKWYEDKLKEEVK